MKNAIILYFNNTCLKFPIPFFLIVLSLTGCASVDITVSTQVGGDKDRAAIHQLMADWERAFNAHDVKAVMQPPMRSKPESLDQSGTEGLSERSGSDSASVADKF